MKNMLKSRLTEALGLVRAFPTRSTDTAEVQALLQRLHPVRCERPLMRWGPQGDGGYLLPDDLDGVEVCFSPGVSFVSGFERDCAEHGMRVFLADKSVDGPAETHPSFHFIKKFIGATTDDDFMTLDDWVASSVADPASDLLLQIDIEGYEYEVILAASDRLMRRFRVIVAEFHALDQLWNGPFFMLARRAFDKLLQTHRCVHIHPNNCAPEIRKDGIGIPPIMEFTFVRADRLGPPAYRSDFPHPLDADNTPFPPLALPRDWYRRA